MIQDTRKERKPPAVLTFKPLTKLTAEELPICTELCTLLSVYQPVKHSSHSYPACLPPLYHQSHIPLTLAPFSLCSSLISRRRQSPPPLPTRIPIPPFGENLPRNRLEARSQCGRNSFVVGEGGPGVRSWMGEGGEGRERDGGGVEG